MTCASCGTANAAGNRFCLQCGASFAPAPTCRACGTAMSPGARFCTVCGTAAAPSSETPGAVVDGEWRRAAGELVRRVPADALRSAFGRLVPGVDWDAFLDGTLAGRLADAVLSRSIRVPMGSVGVVVRDGAVVRVLPPGEQTTAGLLRELASGPRAAAASAIEGWLGSGRGALYLVDRRPIPVSFTAEVPRATGLQTLEATALLSVGGDRDALGAFLRDVVGDRDALAAEDVYVRFRPEIERVVADAVRTRPDDVPAAEEAARDALRGRLARSGLDVELVLAPRQTVHRLDVKLDELLTKDAARVELDLALSVQGEGTPAPPLGVLRAAAERHLRERTWAEAGTGDGFAALEGALSDAAGDALRAHGHRLLALDFVDARSAGEAWTLGARAAMARARAEAEVGREWLGVREAERRTEELSLAAALVEQKMRRDAAFRAREAALDDARRTAGLEEAERELARTRTAADHADAVGAEARLRERERAAAEHRRAVLSGQRRADADDDAYADAKRREARLAELAAMAEIEAGVSEREHRQKLAARQQLEGRSEAQMLAMQAAELAGAEHGAAFAEALGRMADGEAARRERERADARLDAKDERTMALLEEMVRGQREAYRDQAEATKEMARAAVESHAKVAAAQPRSACPSCGAALPPGARFCGACGATMS